MNQQTLNSQVGIVDLFFVGRLHPSLDCIGHQGKGCLGTWLKVEAAAVAGMAEEKRDDSADFKLAGGRTCVASPLSARLHRKLWTRSWGPSAHLDIVSCSTVAATRSQHAQATHASTKCQPQMQCRTETPP
jgi:hypothetical protein